MAFDQITQNFRKKRALTLEEFGAALGVTKQAVSHWEQGRYQPSYRLLIETSVKYQDWRRDWALKCLNIYLDKMETIPAPEQPSTNGDK